MDFVFFVIASVVGILLVISKLFPVVSTQEGHSSRPNEFLVHYFTVLGLTLLAGMPWYEFNGGLQVGLGTVLTIPGSSITFDARVPIDLAMALSLLGCLSSTGVFSVSRVFLMFFGLIEFAIFALVVLLSYHPQTSLMLFALLVLITVCYHFLQWQKGHVEKVTPVKTQGDRP